MKIQLNTIKILIFYFDGNKKHLITLLYPVWRKIFWDYKSLPWRQRRRLVLAEALVGTQDWVRKSSKPIVDNIDEILKDDEVAKDLEEAINNGGGKGKQPINIPE
uniref:Uncharacterized protein n=1 Tax=Lactuca sativa TaxID=4236 RepID=A0A9R1WQZ2_LACSA|nr:hypothetical protein LSAT_V11C900470180 [Lactuca sativa]